MKFEGLITCKIGISESDVSSRNFWRNPETKKLANPMAGGHTDYPKNILGLPNSTLFKYLLNPSPNALRYTESLFCANFTKNSLLCVVFIDYCDSVCDLKVWLERVKDPRLELI